MMMVPFYIDPGLLPDPAHAAQAGVDRWHVAAARDARLWRRTARAGRRTIGRGWVIATYVVLIFFLLWTVVPFFWMFLASIKTNKEIYQDFTFLPEGGLLRPLPRPADRASSRLLAAQQHARLAGRRPCCRSCSARSAPTRSPGCASPAGGSLARALIFTYLLPASLLFIPLFQIVAASTCSQHTRVR